MIIVKARGIYKVAWNRVKSITFCKVIFIITLGAIMQFIFITVNHIVALTRLVDYPQWLLVA